MVNKTTVKLLTEHGMKITPQRIAILDVILGLKNHPTADTICDYLRVTHPHISIGTVYKTLEAFLAKGLIKKVVSDTDSTRYDGIVERHHHLYCTATERIEDFYDEHLDTILKDYLKTKKIPNFEIQDIKLQIIGNFTDRNNR